MTLKSVFAPSLGRAVKLGRNLSPRRARPRLLARDFLDVPNLPTPPETFSYANQTDRASLAAIFGNDALGDCVIAMGYHELGIATGNAGALFLPTPAQIVADYHAIGGYIPGNPSTDNGCNEQDAFDYWQAHGFANGDRLLGSLVIDATNVAEVKACLWAFESISFGVALPDAWISPFPAGDGLVWDYTGAPNPQNGHAFCGVGCPDGRGVQIDTWGLLGTMTWPAVTGYARARNGGELHVAITPAMLAKGQAKAPSGIAWADLIAAFDSLGGNVPAPGPAPTPTPTPPPPGPERLPVTLAQAQEWACSMFPGKGELSRQSAAVLAKRGLAKRWPV